jgi:hypothetical protein
MTTPMHSWNLSCSSSAQTLTVMGIIAATKVRP